MCLKRCAHLRAGAWLFTHLIILSFHLTSYVFSFALHTKLSLPHPLAFGLTHWICGQLLHLVGTHLFYCAHVGECIASHNIIWDGFASILRDMGFHVLHLFLSFHFSHKRSRLEWKSQNKRIFCQRVFEMCF